MWAFYNIDMECYQQTSFSYGREISTTLPNLDEYILVKHSNGDRIIKGLARAIYSSGL